MNKNLPKCYGRGSRKLYASTKRTARQIIKIIQQHPQQQGYHNLPPSIRKRVKATGVDMGCWAKVFEINGIIFKWSTHIRKPNKDLIPHILPTVIYHDVIMGHNLIIQPKVLGFNEFSKGGSDLERWVGYIHQVVKRNKKTNQAIRIGTGSFNSLDAIKIKGVNSLYDLHCCNFGIDGNKVVALDW